MKAYKPGMTSGHAKKKVKTYRGGAAVVNPSKQVRSHAGSSYKKGTQVK